MNNFVTHASVRLKGTETIFDPVLCQDTQCAKKYVPHMHCPFCVRADFFTDPVILKAHYHVKHVDKGIEFAGLKIVRCCDHCDIVGSIKGSKEIKGAHWHCYRCRNGFNRRDEALKHYRTHFRNPQTTFQIQITQDVNQTLITSAVSGDLCLPPNHEIMATGSAERVDGIVGANDERCLQVSVAANETVDTTTSVDMSTIMVLPPENTLTNIVHVSSEQDVNTDLFSLKNEEVSAASAAVWTHQHSSSSEETEEHQTVNHKQSLHAVDPSDAAQFQIHQLQLQVQKQAAEIVALKKRESELMSQLEIHLDDHIGQLLKKMKAEHEELLHRQLSELRCEYLRHLAPSPSTAPSNSHTLMQPMYILNGSDGQPIRIIQSAKIASSSASLAFTTFSSGPELLSHVLPSHDVEDNDGEEAEEEEMEGDDRGIKVEEELVATGQHSLTPETPQNFIVTDDISEYVDAEDVGSDDSELRSGDVVTNQGRVIVPSKRQAEDTDDGTASKRERLQEAGSGL